jgi:hypothetical protein
MNTPTTLSAVPLHPPTQRRSYIGPRALALTLLLAIATIPHARAEHRYRIYRSDGFGLRENPLRPDAVIEIDKQTGGGAIYETDRLGIPDRFNGPKYIIESDTIPFADDSHKMHDEPCDDDDDMHSRHHRRRGHDGLGGLFDE